MPLQMGGGGAALISGNNNNNTHANSGVSGAQRGGGSIGRQGFLFCVLMCWYKRWIFILYF